MKILFIVKHKWPHIGGVERHIEFIKSEILKDCNALQAKFEIKTISSEDINPPHIKFFGLFYIWYWLFKNRDLIARCHLVHIHDVFIWYLPFKFLFPRKKVYITFHGWEGVYPPTTWSILNKKMASFLCNGSIAVGKYIEKYYKIKANYIIHGAAEKLSKTKFKKIENTIVYLGRQDADTGIKEFREWLAGQMAGRFKIKYVTNDPKPEKYLINSEYCVPSGYLSYLEAKSYGCKIITFANNPLKEDYWEEVKKLKSIPTWSEVAEVYIKLWRS